MTSAYRKRRNKREQWRCHENGEGGGEAMGPVFYEGSYQKGAPPIEYPQCPPPPPSYKNGTTPLH